MNTHLPAALLAALFLAAPTAGAATSGAAAPGAAQPGAPDRANAPAAPSVVPAATSVRLTVTGPVPATTALSPDGTAPAAPSARTVTLHCDPAGGDHPRAEAACADLDATRGRVERDSDTACTLLYDPVEVRAEGVWHGRPVSFARQYGNTCELNARTGAVFAF
ncbi:SSI family serine proteinase inhibitor [Streptomyces sp. NRRL F-5727]|uniref:SSI family serine proteinase inhibitor n=1 Tax=Streptomyces sp. NRRL F-5727 TaxID=1463871 RepID=UPI00099DC79B|nr:SSI family serine proteinase inhibitor [Streptomyces sp. NRRL F-5727]